MTAAVLTTAREINRRRQDERRDEFRARALSTPEFRFLVGSMSDCKAVDRRRRRGTLLGARVDLGGRSIADVLAAGDTDLAVRIIALAGDQS